MAQRGSLPGCRCPARREGFVIVLLLGHWDLASHQCMMGSQGLSLLVRLLFPSPQSLPEHGQG